MDEIDDIGVFKCLSDKELLRLKKNVEMKHAEKGENIFIEDGEPYAVFYLIKGSVVIRERIPNTEKEFTKAILGAGQFFGIKYLADGLNKREGIRALDNKVKYFQISTDVLLRLMGGNWCLSKRLTKVIINSTNKIENRLMAYQTKTTRGRVIDQLVELAEETGEQIGKEIIIRDRLTHEDLGELANASRQTVTSLLSYLRKKNMVYYDRTRIIFRDVEQLKELSQLNIKH